LLGFNEEDILYHTFDEFVHPDDKESFHQSGNEPRKRKIHSNLKTATLPIAVSMSG
jgi:hypothetical protein